jgi:thioredoxin reductase
MNKSKLPLLQTSPAAGACCTTSTEVEDSPGSASSRGAGTANEGASQPRAGTVDGGASSPGAGTVNGRATPCCGDPTPDAGTGACCSAPAPDCGCRKSAAFSPATGGDEPFGDGHALPVAVIGAGPIGLTAAAHLISKGDTPVVLEAGEAAGSNVRRWAHVRLFSPWKYLVDPVVREMLVSSGWTMPPDDALPTGAELLANFVEPLAALPQISSRLRLGHRVVAVTRRGFDKVKSAGRDDAPFELVVRTPTGSTVRILARAVIDASGTWSSPNPLGAGGVQAEGEAENSRMIHYGIPDITGRDRRRYAGRRVMVVGSGHSAFNAIVDLSVLRKDEPQTDIVWVVRRRDVGLMFGGRSKDALEARGALGSRMLSLVESGSVRLELGFAITAVAEEGNAVGVVSEDGRRIGGVDEIIVTTGFRPELSLTRELRLGLDSWLEAPTRLAPLIDPNLHSCGTVYPHGAAELSHPERDFYTVGMKSYGRAPTFLLLTGYEQVRSVACALTGDEEGARNVQLVLPETGVCQTDLGGSSCCSPAADATGGRTSGAASLFAASVRPMPLRPESPVAAG